MAGKEVNELQQEWIKANPRPEWLKPEHWAACRPDHGLED